MVVIFTTEISVFPTHCIYALFMTLIVNREYSPLPLKLVFFPHIVFMPSL